MNRRKYTSNWIIVGIGVAVLLIAGTVGVFLSNSDNNSDAAHWFKVNYFPADEFATTSIMDTQSQSLATTEYTGSTPTAWFVSGTVAIVAFAIGMIFLAKERGYFAK